MLFVCVSAACLSVCQFTYVSVVISFCPSVGLSPCLFTYLFSHRPMYLAFFLPVFLSSYLLIYSYLCTYLSVDFLFTYLSTYVSIYLIRQLGRYTCMYARPCLCVFGVYTCVYRTVLQGLMSRGCTLAVRRGTDPRCLDGATS